MPLPGEALKPDEWHLSEEDAETLKKIMLAPSDLCPIEQLEIAYSKMILREGVYRYAYQLATLTGIRASVIEDGILEFLKIQEEITRKEVDYETKSTE